MWKGLKNSFSRPFPLRKSYGCIDIQICPPKTLLTTPLVTLSAHARGGCSSYFVVQSFGTLLLS